jgi:hypothetical protein
MGTLKEYYELDFNHTLKLRGRIIDQDLIILAYLNYDYISNSCFVSLYFNRNNLTLDYFKDFFKNYDRIYSKAFEFDGNVILPSTNLMKGLQVLVKNSNPPDIKVAYPGEFPITIAELFFYGRIFIYSASDLSKDELGELKEYANKLGYKIQFRATEFSKIRSMIEKPLAFISHDNRDKDVIARVIASKLMSMGCPVWYDEYTLRAGDNLRESIEQGIKECKKCILILSSNFLSNKGWTKTEFNSVFTRQIIEEQNIVLPVWYNIEEKQVYEYSPSLLNILGLNWNEGEESVCSKLFQGIMRDVQQ